MGIGIPAGWEIFNGGCPPIETVGACCLPGGSCTSVTEDQCVSLDGVYLGDGEICSPDPCEGKGGTIPPSTEPSTVSESCQNIISWTGSANGFSFQDSCGQSTGWLGNDPPHYILYDPNIVVTMQPTSTCYGVMYASATAHSTTPDITEIVCSFRELISGNPIAGICTAIQPNSTYNNFTGVTLIYDFDTSTVYLQRWTNGDLSNISNGTTLSSSVVSIVSGDIFYMQLWAGAFNEIFAGIYNENFANPSKWDTTVSLSGTTIYNTFGVLCLGNASGSVRFGSSGQGGCTGDPQLTMQVQTDSLPI